MSINSIFNYLIAETELKLNLAIVEKNDSFMNIDSYIYGIIYNYKKIEKLKKLAESIDKYPGINMTFNRKYDMNDTYFSLMFLIVENELTEKSITFMKSLEKVNQFNL